jgi:histidine ammonia-lyase
LGVNKPLPFARQLALDNSRYIMGRASRTIELTGQPLSTEEVEAVAKDAAAVRLTPKALDNLQRSRELLRAAMSDGEPHYGINTGFGALGRVRIDDDALQQLQTNLIRSHSTGVGSPLPEAVVRGTILLLAASLARGHSGVRPVVIERLVALLNHRITPVVPETGSVGASGDLAPLAHIALVLLGEGSVTVDGQVVDSATALAAAGLPPTKLEAKEGLALINGTHVMAARAALVVEAFTRLFDAAIVAAAMSVDACRATDATLDPRVHELRRQPGQQLVAERLRACLAGSEIVRSHTEDDPRVQDPYSFRCCPAVLGAAWDAFTFVRIQIENELGAVSDNPLIFASDNPNRPAEILSGGNFHGLPIAVPLDTLAIATSHVAGISERRTFHMLSGRDPEAELPTFLTPKAGLQSGLMIVQYTAAACCNELIGLATPASVANITTSAGMEDYNSFGPRCAAKAARGVQLARSVVAIEMLCAATGLDHHRPLRSGVLVESAFEKIRHRVPTLTEDRAPAPDIAAIEALIEEGAFSLE